jgi:outer membrane lipoprotein carrier protein
MRIIISLFWIFLCAVGHAQTALDQFWDDLKSFSADFEQQTFDDRGQLLRKSRGHIDFLAPNRFYIQDDHGQVIVADGQWIWMHDRDLNQVIRKSQNHALKEAPAAVLFRGRQLQDIYHIAEIGQKGDLIWYEARPRQDETFDAILLGFRGQALCDLEMRDAFAQKTTIHFINGRKNSSLPAARFVFHTPEHADVVIEE